MQQDAGLATLQRGMGYVLCHADLAGSLVKVRRTGASPSKDKTISPQRRRDTEKTRLVFSVSLRLCDKGLQSFVVRGF
jgi:hypothetical protein